MAEVDAETVRGIQGNAATVVGGMQKLHGTAFGYDETSVLWLDGYINRIRKGNDYSGTENVPDVVAPTHLLPSEGCRAERLLGCVTNG